MSLWSHTIKKMQLSKAKTKKSLLTIITKRSWCTYNLG